MEETKKKTEKKLLRGIVVSDDMDKTIVAEFKRTYKNRHTKKIMRSIKKYKIHDAKEEAKVGDIVEFYEGRPVSKTKYMYLDRVVK